MRLELRVLLLACVLGGAAPLRAEEAAQVKPVTSRACARTGRLMPPARMGEGPWESSALPRSDLFQPGAADPKQPRNYGTLLRVWNHDEGEPTPGSRMFTGGFVAVGGTFGAWGLREAEGCDGVQVEFEGAVFAQFNLSTRSDVLINADYFVAVPITFRKGALSARLRLFHQSSHLGDELLDFYPEVDFSELSVDGLDATVSWDGPWWRVYGGAGFVLRAYPKIDRLILSGGLELFGPAWPETAGRPFALSTLLAVDLESLKERDFGLTATALAGLELTSSSSSHRVRVGVQVLGGYLPFGRFFLNERVRTVGGVLQLIV